MFHGSRDCRTQAAADNLRQLLVAKYQSMNILTQQNYLAKDLITFKHKNGFPLKQFKPPLIEIAALELADLTLSESLINFAHQASRYGIKQIKVVPLFLVPGVHVTEDIPAEIALANEQIDYQVQIKLSPYLGKYSGIVPHLSRKFAELSGKTRILIAHGSRLSAGAKYYQGLASQLGAKLAYWSTDPKFSDLITAQITSGSKKIAILPYFLFPGKITEAIAAEVARLQSQYPQVKLFLGKPLGATEAVAELIAKEV